MIHPQPVGEAEVEASGQKRRVPFHQERRELRFASAAAKGASPLVRHGDLEHFGQERRFKLIPGPGHSRRAGAFHPKSFDVHVGTR